MARFQTYSAAGKWFLLWTAIGCVFSLQLRWYYELPWSTSIFWGLADWYLWGLLAIGVFKGVGSLKDLGWRGRSRLILYALTAPVLAAIHVVLTMVVGGIDDLPGTTNLPGYFQALYAKKLTLNLLTFGAIAAVCEHLLSRAPRRDGSFLAKVGETTRVVDADQIIWGEVFGNYVNLHTKDGVWPVRETLTSMMRHLPPQQFVQISRSRMVNLDCVRELSSKSGRIRIALTDGSESQVARRHGARVRQALRDYCVAGVTKRNQYPVSLETDL
ncbi:MAG: LytTR family transcriptional regulator [Gammaproteobacteria bacterium]|nr:LytTR family transcriptional regulator [Gammaproteobacteria bacterium]